MTTPRRFPPPWQVEADTWEAECLLMALSGHSQVSLGMSAFGDKADITDPHY